MEASQALAHLCGAAVGLFVFVDELLELMQFGRLDILKRATEYFLSNPLHCTRSSSIEACYSAPGMANGTQIAFPV